MKILLVNNAVLPVHKYGGTERIVWDLGKNLASRGHQVYFLLPKGSSCPFAKEVIFFDSSKRIEEQIPECIDVVHFHSNAEPISKPYLITMHGNRSEYGEMDPNTVFISSNQAKRYQAKHFVYNGLDWDHYLKPRLENTRSSVHFLGNAAWKVKNIKDAISISRRAKESLLVLGGTRVNFKMGFRITLDRHVRFMGMVDNREKSEYLNQSKGLLFPVLWNEPFGLALIESLYFGCPVFGTKNGSLPELINQKVGYLSNSKSDLVRALMEASSFNRQLCHEYARDLFNAEQMTNAYLTLYEKVLNGSAVQEDKPICIEDSLNRGVCREMEE